MKRILFLLILSFALTSCGTYTYYPKTGYYIKTLQPSIEYSIGSDINYPLGVFLDVSDSTIYAVENYYDNHLRGKVVKLYLRPTSQAAGTYYNWERRRFIIYKIGSNERSVSPEENLLDLEVGGEPFRIH